MEPLQKYVSISFETKKDFSKLVSKRRRNYWTFIKISVGIYVSVEYRIPSLWNPVTITNEKEPLCYLVNCQNTDIDTIYSDKSNIFY